MADVETLRGLLERVRAATGSEDSRLLDAHLICVLVAPPEAFISIGPISGAPRVNVGTMQDGRDRLWEPWLEWRHVRPAISVDDSLILIGGVLPDWDWKVGDQTRDGLGQWLLSARGATPALALCAELLSALIAQAEGAEP